MANALLPDEWPEDKPENVGDYKLTFGQHKGERLSDVPIRYLEWCLDEDFDDELKEKIRTHLDRQADYHDDGPEYDNDEGQNSDWEDDNGSPDYE